MIVSRRNFDSVLSSLSTKKVFAVDTETTGLNPYKGHSLFSIIIACDDESYYFNFKNYETLDPDFILGLPHLKAIGELFASDMFRVFAMHNSKFDLAMLRKEGITPAGIIHDTEMVARLLYNQHFNYSLEACVKRIGLKKSDEVDKYISEHKLYTETVSNEDKKIKVPHFDQVPFDIISRYGEQDGRITYALYLRQVADLEHTSLLTPDYKTSIKNVYRNDCKLIPVVADMEWVGIKINRPYVQEAYHYEMDLKAQAEAEFEAISGHPLVDSGKSLAEAFTAVGEEYPLTDKGNPSFTAEVLEGFKTPLARVLLKYRSALKLAGTYYANFLTMADSEDLIHANLRLAGTATGRLSCASPNLQNLAKEENTEQKYTVRRSFVPRPDYCFVMIDYQAAEYRLLLDLCGQTDVSHQVLAGLDVHAATAKMMGVTRSEAKTLNFMLLYGGGVGKLALSLGIPLGRAKELKNTYFDAMPEVTKWTRELVKWAEQNKHFSNLYGFIYQFPNSDHCYAAPNHMIQGCCAQIIRFAMVELHKRLQSMKSRMLLSVHDEVIFEVHKSELHIVDDLKAIMEQSYTPRLLPQACEVTHSWVSWADKTKGNPT